MANSKFAKRHYEVVAQAIAAAIQLGYDSHSNVEYEMSLRGARAVAQMLSIQFQKDNPKFDDGRFMTACGLE